MKSCYIIIALLLSIFSVGCSSDKNKEIQMNINNIVILQGDFDITGGQLKNKKSDYYYRREGSQLYVSDKPINSFNGSNTIVFNNNGYNDGVIGSNNNSINNYGSNNTIVNSNNEIHITTDKEVIYVNGKKIEIDGSEISNQDDDNKISSIDLLKPLKVLSISGSGSLDIQKVAFDHNLSLKISGSGRLNINQLKEIQLNSLDIKLSGSGNISISKFKINDLDSKISGSGGVDIKRSYITNGDFKISGVGNINLNGSKVENISKKISGVGNINN